MRIGPINVEKVSSGKIPVFCIAAMSDAVKVGGKALRLQTQERIFLADGDETTVEWGRADDVKNMTLAAKDGELTIKYKPLHDD